jgi:hypothetical protein
MMKTRMKTSHLHPVIRIIPMEKFGLSTIDPIEEHNRIFAREGSVAFAKFGNPDRQPNCDALCNAISDGYTTYLYVVIKKGSQYKSFRAPIGQILLRSKPADVLQPPYYKDIGVIASLWFILSKPLTPYPIEGLWVASSQRPLRKALKDSRCPMMMATTRL